MQFFFICYIALCQYIQASKAQDGGGRFFSSSAEGKTKTGGKHSKLEFI